MSKNLIFYGHFSGWSSYPSVCKALANWLFDNKPDDASLLLCDLRREAEYECVRHIDRVDPFSQMCIASQHNAGSALPAAAGNIYSEYQALLFGFPVWWSILPKHDRRIGYHVCDVDTIPPEWATEISAIDDVITPSSWCSGVFRSMIPKLKLSKIHHGITAFDYKQKIRKGSKLRFVHFCSSAGLERKGTKQLARAWTASGLGRYATLDCFTTFDSSRSNLLQTSFSKTIIKPATLPVEFNRLLQSYDAVIAPSRAEGFGIIPLEAAAHGMPVVMTTETGHSEHCEASSHKDLQLSRGAMEPCPPGPGYAPELSETDLCEKLELLYRDFDQYKEAALSKAENVRSHWDWNAVLKRGKLLKLLGWQ